MRYRRPKTSGATFFFTLVTYKRMKILCAAKTLLLLREAFSHVRQERPFTVDAIVLLPDHLHCIMTLPDGDGDFSCKLRLIKTYFTKRCNNAHKSDICKSRERRKEQAIWQRRFWEHQIRDDDDFIKHVEYIHYNPVKHGYVKKPRDWKWSTFHRYVKEGIYDINWGSTEKIKLDDSIVQE